MSRVRRVLLGDGGAGALVGTGLMLAVGLALTYSAVRDIRAAVAPARLSCGAFLADPSQARWVVLEGCRLDVARASRDEPRGEVTVPVMVGAAGPVRLVVVSKDAALLALAASLASLPPEQVAGSLEARAAEVGPLLSPKALEGPVSVVTPERSLALGGEGGEVRVLELSQEAARLGALGRLVVGLLVMLFAFWPVARRFQLERDLASLANNAGHEGPARSPGED